MVLNVTIAGITDGNQSIFHYGQIFIENQTYNIISTFFLKMIVCRRTWAEIESHMTLDVITCLIKNALISNTVEFLIMFRQIFS